MILALVAAAIVTAAFVFAFSIEPFAGMALIFCFAFWLILVKKPFLGTLGYVFTVGFVALFNLPITADGLQISTVILLITVSTCAALLIVTRDTTLFTRPLGKPEHLLLLGLAIIILLSIKNTRNANEAITGLKQIIYALASYYLIVLTVRTAKELNAVIWVAVLSGVVIALFGIDEMLDVSIYKTLQYRSIFGADLNKCIERVARGRINGMAAAGDLHGAYMAFVTMLALYLFLTVRSRWLKAFLAGSFVLFFINIFGAASRGAVLGFAVMLSVWWLFWNNRHKVLVAAAVIPAALLTVVLMVAATNLKIDRLYTEPEGTDLETIEFRIECFKVSLLMFYDNPVLGHGPRGFDIEYQSYAFKADPSARFRDTNNHILYLDVIVNYGLVGFTIFALFIFFILKRLLALTLHLHGSERTLANCLLGAFCGYMLFMGSTGFFVDKIFWLLLALSATAYAVFEPKMALLRQSESDRPSGERLIGGSRSRSPTPFPL